MANKLYFDCFMAAATTNRSFLATQFTAGSIGDRFGSLLTPLESCVLGVTPYGVQRSREVSAWFRLTQAAGASATADLPTFAVRFVQPTVPGANQAGLKSLTGASGTENTWGSSAIFGTAGTLRNFSVQVQKRVRTTGTSSINGVLYVQRQHSIEV